MSEIQNNYNSYLYKVTPKANKATSGTSKVTTGKGSSTKVSSDKDSSSKPRSKLSFGITLIISIIMIILGFYIIYSKSYSKAKAKILSIDQCISGSNMFDDHNDCLVKISYVVGDALFVQNINYRYKKNELVDIKKKLETDANNQTIDIGYNRKNANDITLINPTFILIFAIVLLISGIIGTGFIIAG